MLTRKQYDLLHFIHKRLQRDGVPPSFDEMKEALDLRSKSGIHRLITALEERGFIRRLPHRARAIEIVRLPETLDATGGFQPEVVPGGRPDRPAARGGARAPPPPPPPPPRGGGPPRWGPGSGAAPPPPRRSRRSSRCRTTSPSPPRCSPPLAGTTRSRSRETR